MADIECYLKVSKVNLFNEKNKSGGLFKQSAWLNDLLSSELSVRILVFLILTILATCIIYEFPLFLKYNLNLFFQLFLFSYVFTYLYGEKFTEDYNKVSEILKNLITSKTLESKNIYIYAPSKGYFQFNGIEPSRHIFCLSDTENISPKIGEKHYIILNSKKLKSNSISTTLKPYADAIACNYLLDNQSIWRYFLTFFFTTNIIYGIFVFIMLMLTKPILSALGNKEIQILFFGLYITLLTIFFAKVIWKLIYNIHLKRCKKSRRREIISNMEIPSIDTEEQYFSQSLILLKQYKKTTIIDTKDLLKKVNKTNKKLTEKITNIIQIAAPLFYLAYITISITVLKN